MAPTISKEGFESTITDDDLALLEAKARSSEQEEAYFMVAGGKDYRLGVVIRISADGVCIYSIEFLMHAFSIYGELQIPMMEMTVSLARTLKDRGYGMMYEDGGWLSCEKAILREEILYECEAIMNVVLGFNRDKQVLEKKYEEDV